jgi:hypothetical protein
MGLLNRFFGTKRSDDQLVADRDRQAILAQSLHGQAVIQSPAEQQAVRERMVAELDEQRQGHPPVRV